MLCECGCGRETSVSPWNNKQRGYKAGDHFRFIQGHNHPRKGRPLTAIEIRFLSKIRKTETCWEWTGAITHQGYGVLGVKAKDGTRKGGKSSRWLLKRAHRISWEMTYGEVPVGLLVLHKCDNPKCVRPEHLFLGTVKDNALDMAKKHRGRGFFTAAQVVRIRTLHTNGMTYKKIAKEMGCTWWVIAQLILGNTYKWVPPHSEIQFAGIKDEEIPF